MNRSKRNGKIELLRFLFAVAIVLYHCQKHYLDVDKSSFHMAFFSCGYIGVEFFFLVAGFLMAKSIYKRTVIQDFDLGLETVQFTWRKIKAILPWHFTAFGIMFLAKVILDNYSLRDTLSYFLKTIPNLFLFSKTGFNFGNLNRVEWYITCMIFAMLILYPLCRKYYSMFVHVIAPVGGMFLLGYLAQNFGTFTDSSRWNGLMFTCMIRAIAEIALGATAFEISRVIGEKKFTATERKLLTVGEVCGYLFIFAYVMSTMNRKYEIFAVLVLIISIALTFSGQVYGNALFNNKLCYFLGKASLPIYLSQVLPLDFVKEYLVQYNGWEKTAAMFMLTMINAVLCACIIKMVSFIWKKRIHISIKG